MEIKIDRTTLLSNTTEKYEQTYNPITIGTPSTGTVCKQISVSAMRVVDGIYDLVVADITSAKASQIAYIHSRAVDAPATFA